MLPHRPHQTQFVGTVVRRRVPAGWTGGPQLGTPPPSGKKAGKPHGPARRCPPGGTLCQAGSMPRADRIPAWVRRTGIEVAGWTLIVLGVAGLVLPGPGLLLLVAGLAILSLRYDWADRWLHPVKVQAYRAAEQGVQSWIRIAIALTSALTLIAAGITWGLWRTVPAWWPLEEDWWLPGGWTTGSALILSGCIAIALIVYSYVKFRPSR